jgi:TrmH family RNA methyltransferase
MTDIYSLFREVSSSQNPLLKEIRTFQGTSGAASKLREAKSLALIEGIHLLQSWNSSTESFLDIRVVLTTNAGLLNSEISHLIAQMVNHSAGCAHIDFVLVDESIWHELSDLGHAPHLISLVAIPESFDLINFDRDVVVLDGIQDAGNVGTILRTSLAAGFRHVIALKGTAHLWSPKVLRAAMGAHSNLKIKEGVKSSDFVSDVPTQKISARLHDAKSIYDLSTELKKPLAWVFGNEGQGVSELVMENSLGAYIPIHAEVESLNVASAAAVCLFETSRVRGAK